MSEDLWVSYVNLVSGDIIWTNSYTPRLQATYPEPRGAPQGRAPTPDSGQEPFQVHRVDGVLAE